VLKVVKDERQLEDLGIGYPEAEATGLAKGQVKDARGHLLEHGTVVSELGAGVQGYGGLASRALRHELCEARGRLVLEARRIGDDPHLEFHRLGGAGFLTAGRPETTHGRQARER